MKAKKIFAGFMSVALVLALTACSQAETDYGGVIFPSSSSDGEKTETIENVKDCSSAPTGIPEVSEEGRVFEINAFSIPRPDAFLNDGAIEDAKNAGVTDIIIDPWGGFNYKTAEGLEKMDRLFRLLDKHGLNGYVSTDNGYATRGNGQQFGPDHTWRSIADIKYDFTQYASFKGIMAFDEPGGSFGNKEDQSINDFAFLEREFELFKGLWEDPDGDGPEEAVFKTGKYTDYRFFVNGCGDKQNVYEPLAERIYPKILEDGESLLMVSLDAYPFKYDTISQKAYLAEQYLYYIELFAEYARVHDCPFYNYIETTDIYNTGRSADSMLGEEEILFQLGCMFAYGAKGIGLFTYATAGDMQGLVDNGAIKLDSYFYCQKTFREINRFADVYLDFGYQGTMTFIGTKNQLGYNDAFDLLEHSLESYDRIRSVTATRDTLVGCFKNADGYDAFVIQNYNDPYYRKSDDVKITFNNATKAVVYYFEDGEMKHEVKNLENGTLSQKVTFGKFVFVIPVV